MTAKTLDELEANPPKFKPAEVEIEGLDYPIFVHRFSAADLEKIMQDSDDDSKQTEVVINRVLKFLRGADYKPTKAARDKLLSLFTMAQLRDIHSKGYRLNGLGEDSLKDALKN